MTRRHGVTLAAAAIALALGILAYATLREGLQLHDWLAALGWTAATPSSSWIATVLPDALWQFAFCTCGFMIWRGSPRRRIAAVGMAVPIVLGLGTEIGQAVGVIEGVFDRQDLIAMLIASAAAYGWVHRPPVGSLRPSKVGLSFN